MRALEQQLARGDLAKIKHTLLKIKQLMMQRLPLQHHEVRVPFIEMEKMMTDRSEGLILLTGVAWSKVKGMKKMDMWLPVREP
jgi:hypothetical protein